MKIKFNIKVGLLVAYGAMLCAPLVAAHAVSDTVTSVNTAYQLTTSPVSVSVEGKPGSPVSTDLRVRNDSAVTQKIRISMLKFSAKGEEGKPVLDDRKPEDNYFDWVTFSKNDFFVLPNEWATVKMTINVPATAANGYYYAVRFSRISDNATAAPGEKKFVGSNSILVLLNAKNPNAKRELALLEFTSVKRVYEALPATFSARLHNAGNVHIAPAGSVFILRGKKTLAVLDFNKAGGNILPDSNRIFKTEWSDGFPHYEQVNDSSGVGKVDKIGKPIMHLVWNFNQLSNIRFGQYTARLVAVYQDNDGRDIPLEADVSFWVIPWKVIGVLLLILVFVPIGMYATGRTIWKKSKHNRT